jgi:hypothetical protein
MLHHPAGGRCGRGSRLWRRVEGSYTTASSPPPPSPSPFSRGRACPHSLAQHRAGLRWRGGACRAGRCRSYTCRLRLDAQNPRRRVPWGSQLLLQNLQRLLQLGAAQFPLIDDDCRRAGPDVLRQERDAMLQACNLGLPVQGLVSACHGSALLGLLLWLGGCDDATDGHRTALVVAVVVADGAVAEGAEPRVRGVPGLAGPEPLGAHFVEAAVAVGDDQAALLPRGTRQAQAGGPVLRVPEVEHRADLRHHQVVAQRAVLVQHRACIPLSTLQRDRRGRHADQRRAGFRLLRELLDQHAQLRVLGAGFFQGQSFHASSKDQRDKGIRRAALRLPCARLPQPGVFALLRALRDGTVAQDVAGDLHVYFS